MSISSLLVHLDSGERSKVRLKVAADLARAKSAKLTGLFAQIVAPHQVGLVAEWPSAAYAQAAEASRAEFLAATAKLDAEWIDLDRGDEKEIVRRATEIARHFDMIVLGRRCAENALVPADFAEQLILHSGRPVLVLPDVGEFKTIGKRPIFAWADSAAASRGLTNGVPLVMPRIEVLVAGFSTRNDPDALAAQKDSLNLTVAHLAAHKICAYAEQSPVGDIGLTEALLNRAADHHADLVVIGAFGGDDSLPSHGEDTRDMLRRLTTPVLFSH
jgi:nucleotide-binding universal stress UspA family protein